MIYSWKKIVRTALPLLTLCAALEIAAGNVLLNGQASLVNLPVFLLSIPVINGVGGNIGSILGARVASGLHVGLIELDVKDKKLQENLLNTILIGIVIYTLLAIIIYSITWFVGVNGTIGVWSYIGTLLGTGVVLILVISLVSVGAALLSFHYGLDPDDVVAPVVTTIGDTIGIVMLFVMMGVFGFV